MLSTFDAINIGGCLRDRGPRLPVRDGKVVADGDGA